MKFSLAEAVSNALREGGMTKTEAEGHARKVNEIIEGALLSGDEVVIAEAGSLSVAVRSARSGRNPATGATVQLPETRTLRFSGYRAFRRRLNAPAE